jgi:hypothetical protein
LLNLAIDRKRHMQTEPSGSGEFHGKVAIVTGGEEASGERRACGSRREGLVWSSRISILTRRPRS